MPMDENVRLAKRAGARFFGVLLQLISVLTFLGTLATAIKVEHYGADIGIGGSHDPAVWIVLLGGILASSVLAGMGYTLGILCAIFDRQGSSEPAVKANSIPLPSNLPTEPTPFKPGTLTPNTEATQSTM